RNKLKGGAEVGGVLSTFIQNDNTARTQQALPQKCKDLEIFSVPCTIGGCTFADAMLDLGASINVMPASVYKSLNFGDLEPTDGRRNIWKRVFFNSLMTILDDGKDED
ncbi:hypothetical protein CR513_01111, partial [Mucuna pruriens]